MPANLTFDQLKSAVKAGEIDTVIACIVDMQGRMQGKRFHARHFVDSAWEETHCCNYLLATDMEMNTVQGYAATSWAAGYGDYVMKPDLATLRRLPWLEGTAMVMCDALDHHSHEPVPHAPRSVLKRQIERARAMGFDAMMATELEFYLFEESFPELFDNGYPDPTPIARYNVDYSIFGTARDEPIIRAIRNDLWDAGIPIECSKGEADAGQQEVNAKFSDALDTADMHCIIKQGVKEIAQQHGASATFMAKYDHRRAGSSSHVHQSLWRAGKNIFHDPAAPHGPLHRRATGPCRGYHGLPCALRQQLQTFLRGHVRPHEGGLEPGQPHRGFPRLRREYEIRAGRMPHRRRRSEPLSCLRRPAGCRA